MSWNWMKDYEERIDQRNEEVYKLILKNREKTKKIKEDEINSKNNVLKKYQSYNEGIQKLLFDNQDLLEK